MIKITLKWQDPLDLTSKFLDEKYLTFLFSGYINSFTGRKSFLCVSPSKIIKSNNFTEFETEISKSDNRHILGRWFGYLSYDLKNELERLPIDSDTYVETPKLFMVRYNIIFEFDHILKQIILYAANEKFMDYGISRYESTESLNSSEDIVATNLSSNMTDEEYYKAFDVIMEAIKAGDIYQANLTRKFFGEVSNDSNKLSLFRKLSAISPSPYSAYMKFDDVEILSSSPEQFITIDSDGSCTSRPIKGTARRGATEEEDRKIIENLGNCKKNKAENLMITDLMRNDFARSSVVGSVSVQDLFKVSSYATLHHMSSTVICKKDPDISSLGFIKNAFPPGSMTGCPKIKAIEICSGVEKLRRGIYSGVLGYFGEDGIVDLSVVIRTLIFKQNKFEFQVGGAITYNSTAEDELEESYLKAKGIAMALNLSLREEFV